MNQKGKEMHDLLKADMPELSCIDNCPFCELDSLEGGEYMSDKIYNQETFDALVAAARSESAQEAKEAVSEELAAIRASLEEKEEALDAANQRIETLESEKEAQAEEIRLAALADERALKVAEVTKFSDEQVAERKAGWALLSEEAFAQVLTDFTAVAEIAQGEAGKPKSNFSALRETAGSKGTDLSRLRDVLAASGKLRA